MILLLETAAAAAPEGLAVVTDEGSSTYAELLDGARRIAAGLRCRGLTSFAVVEHDAGVLLRLLAGAALAGAEPCQYQPDTSASDFEAHAKALGHDVVVTRRDDLGEGFTIIRPDELRSATADPSMTPGTAQPLMIRTTGTTGLPKSARHDWQRLAATVATVDRRPDQRWLLAYGPQQFAGIQVLVHTMAAGATLIAPFPRQPRDGLAALLEGGVTCVSATPTYWRFLLSEARSRDLTLPPLEQITLGGEASPGDLLRDLRERFPEARISQVYASTEFGSVTSVKDGLPGLAVSSLWREDNPKSNMKVVDGELWLRSQFGMIGYADGSEIAAGEWRPSGDLVEIIDDRVHFRGRNSDIINVGGVKVHPLPVEERISALDGVALTRVFGRPNKLTGAIVAAEIVPATGTEDTDLDALRDEVRQAVADLPRAWQPRSITFVDAITTKGGKTVRGTESP